MAVGTIALGQVTLGVIALGWAVYLLPRTGLIWWLAGNAAYGALALTAASRYLGNQWAGGLGLAMVGTVIFVACNAAPAIWACRAGGACVQIVTVLGLVVALQIAVVVGAQRAG